MDCLGYEVGYRSEICAKLETRLERRERVIGHDTPCDKQRGYHDHQAVFYDLGHCISRSRLDISSNVGRFILSNLQA